MTALVLLGIGARDLASLAPAARGRRRWLALAVAGVVVLLGGLWLALAALPSLGSAAWPRAAAAVLAGLGTVGVWHALAAAPPVARVGVVAGLAVLAVAEHAGQPAPSGVGALTVIGAGLVLVETANVLTRDVLVLAGRPSAEAPAVPGRRADRRAGSGLRGGRFIGPMERILMAVLGLLQAWQVVAALMAAKGIVRFPEISRDARSDDPRGGPSGASAEEFLVGSLASWSLAAGAGLLVHLALPGA